MTKHTLTARIALFLALAALVPLPLAAQTSSRTLLDVNKYSEVCGYVPVGAWRADVFRFRRSLTEQEAEQFGNLSGEFFEDDGKLYALLDTPLEFALMSYYIPDAIDKRPPEADAILPANDPKLSGKKLGAAVLKELTELKFLDPSNTAAIGRYEGMIKFISDKNGVSRAEIESYYRQGIGALVAETVDAEFNKVSFMIDRKYNTVLAHDSQTGQYILSYERPSVESDDKELSAVSLNALLSTMQNSSDFSQSAIDIVREQAALIPATRLGNKAISGITDILVNLYMNPTNSVAYDMVKAVFALYQNLESRRATNSVFEKVATAYSLTLYALNTELEKKVVQDWLQQRQAYTMLTNEQQQVFAGLQN
jgi:hypothetical protein